jgi:hypothetical protein
VSGFEHLNPVADGVKSYVLANQFSDVMAGSRASADAMVDVKVGDFEKGVEFDYDRV